jgi:23S rRNA (cytidine1920-2'-O)/16S rRNA (cytidine1409-2'-O)-methyltransferase
MKQRLDQELVSRGLTPTREKARALILAGKVLVDQVKQDKAGFAVKQGAEITLLESLPYVSRGGLKLAGALTHWNIPVADRVCIDIGASTGGFTDCLIQHGAARVHSVDVGPSQMDWTLRNHPLVTLHEHCNARFLEPATIGEQASLLVCDVSFISVTLLLDRFPALLSPWNERAPEMVILVKPQFELRREDIGPGGIVRQPELHEEACQRVQQKAESLQFRCQLTESPITGAKGNREFLLYASR